VTTLSDDELVAGLEAACLPPGSFTHAAHVRAAFLMLRQAPLHQAAARFMKALRGYATAAGVPGKYDEALTWSYLRLIHERMLRGGERDWDGFAAANPDLLERRVTPASAPPAGAPGRSERTA
jgi:hypothetical protein